MGERYYIDGYNVLHRDAVLSDLAAQDLEAAREALIEAVSRWCTHTGHRASLVFDGQGIQAEHVSRDPGRPNVDVVFTAARLSADAVIERGVYGADARQTVVVVSGDRGIRDLCLGMGALSMTPEHFLAMLHAPGGGPSNTPRAKGQSGRRLGAMEDLVDEAARHQLRVLRDRLRGSD